MIKIHFCHLLNYCIAISRSFFFKLVKERNVICLSLFFLILGIISPLTSKDIDIIKTTIICVYNLKN